MASQLTKYQVNATDFPSFLRIYLMEKYPATNMTAKTLIDAEEELLFRFFTILLDKSFENSREAGEKEVTTDTINLALTNIISDDESTKQMQLLGDRLICDYFKKKIAEQRKEEIEKEERVVKDDSDEMTSSIEEDFRRAKTTQPSVESQPSVQSQQSTSSLTIWDWEKDF